jgi:hypothetical protein
MLGYLNGISFLGYDFQSYPNSQKISLHILTYPFISYHIPTYPKISSGANSQMADGVVNQVGPSGTAHGSSEIVKAHTPRRDRPSCRNTPPGGLVGAALWSRSGTGPLPLRTRRVSYGEVLFISWIQPTWESGPLSGEVLQPEASGPRRHPTLILGFL